MLTLVLTTSTGEKREILTTEDHPFWSQSDQEFQRADELVPGEQVLTADGGSMEVHAIETEEVTYGPAWNLTVQGLHTYSVIATGADVGAGTTRGPPAHAQTDAVLVHNCPIAPGQPGAAGAGARGGGHGSPGSLADNLGDDVVFHYTDETGLNGITGSGVLKPDGKGRVFVTQEMLSAGDAHNVLFAGAPSHAGRGSHLLAIRLREGAAVEQQVQRFELVHQGALRFDPSDIVFSGINPF